MFFVSETVINLKCMNTLFVGRTTIDLDSTDSTNNHALNVLKSHFIPEGTVVVAYEQFAGRGERHNVWVSEPGENLTFSVVLYPTFLPAVHQFRLNKAISLAIADYLSVYADDVKIKWPNDIMVGDKKVAGILIESQLKNTYLSQSIIGLGVNLNQREFPDLPNASSLWIETGVHLNRMLELRKLCGFIEQRYLKLKQGRNDLLRKEYVERLYKVDQWLEFADVDGIFKGRLINVEPSGRLLVEREGGEIRSYAYKEVKFHGLSS